MVVVFIVVVVLVCGFCSGLVWCSCMFVEVVLALALVFASCGQVTRHFDQRRNAPPRFQINIAKDMFAGLMHLHSKRIIHRDIKPANILLDHGQASPSISLCVIVV